MEPITNGTAITYATNSAIRIPIMNSFTSQPVGISRSAPDDVSLQMVIEPAEPPIILSPGFGSDHDRRQCGDIQHPPRNVFLFSAEARFYRCKRLVNIMAWSIRAMRIVFCTLAPQPGYSALPCCGTAPRGLACGVGDSEDRGVAIGGGANHESANLRQCRVYGDNSQGAGSVSGRKRVFGIGVFTSAFDVLLADTLERSRSRQAALS